MEVYFLAITLAKIDWQTVIAGVAVIGTIVYNFAKQRQDRLSQTEQSVTESISALTMIYKELVDDLRLEVGRLKDANKVLADEVKSLQDDNKSLRQAVIDLTTKIETLHREAP